MDHGSEPVWISRWGAAGFGLTILALLCVSGTDLRFLTLTFSALGVLASLWTVWAVRPLRTKDYTWLTIGVGSGATVLSLAVFWPGVLNRFWDMNAAVPTPDPNHITIVPRDEPRDKGRPLAQEDAADPDKEAIRQEDVHLRIDSIATRELADRPGKEFLLIHLRLASAGHVQTIAFRGFSDSLHKPTLKDAAGRSYAFLEQRPRKLGAGPPHVFISAPARTVQISPGRFFDSQLIFEAPPTGFAALTLELPATAWDRQGVCRFRITGPFEAPPLPGEPGKGG